MRKKYYRVFFLASTLFFIVAAQAQRKQTVFKKKLVDEKGNTTMVVFDDSSNYSVEDAKALLLKSTTGRGTNNNSILSRVSTESDELGFTHEKQQQFYKGIKVEFATYRFHLKGGAVESMNGEFYDINIDKVTPTLTSQQALEKAKKHIGAKRYMWEQGGINNTAPEHKKPEGELVILAAELIDKDQARLAYKFDIYASEPLSRGNLYIDADTGESLFYDAIIKHVGEHAHRPKRLKSSENKALKVSEPEVINFAPLALVSTSLETGNAATRYSGTRKIGTTRDGGRYILKDGTRKGIQTYNMRNREEDYYGAVNFTDDDNNWTAAEFDNHAKDNAALDAHWGAMMTYDYFKKVHDRDSFDNNGAAIKSYVHVGDRYPNAYWNGKVMSYGDGDSNGQEGNGRFDAMTSLDVAAHEIGHAVCSNTANLAYRKESGGMNEGFSDIWGACVEHFAKGNGNDMHPDETIWLLGDEIDRRRGSKSFRSMIRPNDGNQPDTYGGRYWRDVDNCYPNGSNDNCGVHTNSGVLNFWFYLLVEGGSGTNDNGDEYKIEEGVGMTKAAKITFRLEAHYLSSNAKYKTAREGSIKVAGDLYGKNSKEVIAVTNAWHAVGVGDRYDGEGDGGGGSNSYCKSKGNSDEEYIKRVKLGSIDKTSGGKGYSNFTSVSTELSKDKSYKIEITPHWRGDKYEEAYGVWIDYNQDGDFTDSGEKVLLKGPTTQNLISTEFKVPDTAKPGKTRMRVSMKYAGQDSSGEMPNPCQKIKYGEVEDYTVIIPGGDDNSDKEAPTAPTGLKAVDITKTQAAVTWTASKDNVGVVAYEVYYNSKKVATVEHLSVTLSKLKQGTSYTVSVLARDAAGNKSPKASVTFKTLGVKTHSYCKSKGQSSDDEWIDYVSFGKMINSSGNDGGYKDYTRKVANVSRGSVSELVISAGFKGRPYNEYWGVWIDYNQNGVFEDSERVVKGRASTADKLSVKVNIPSSAALGETRMRVSMKFKNSQKACETFEYGEVEDYSVNIGNSFMGMLGAKPSVELTADTKQLVDEELVDFMVYPNPASNFIAVQLGATREATYRIVNVIGQSVQAGKLTSENIDISQLKEGIYVIEVNDGQKLYKTKIIKK